MKRLLFYACLFGTLLLATYVRCDEKESEDEEKESEVGTVIGIDLGTTYSW